jgi:hypothetical protein
MICLTYEAHIYHLVALENPLSPLLNYEYLRRHQQLLLEACICWSNFYVHFCHNCLLYFACFPYTPTKCALLPSNSKGRLHICLKLQTFHLLKGSCRSLYWGETSSDSLRVWQYTCVWVRASVYTRYMDIKAVEMCSFITTMTIMLRNIFVMALASVCSFSCTDSGHLHTTKP